MRLSPRGNYIMMFTNHAAPTGQRSILSLRTVGAITLAIAISLVFILDMDEIRNYSIGQLKLSFSSSVNSAASVKCNTDNGSVDAAADNADTAADTDKSTPGCPGCAGLWKPDYDYEANHEEWDAKWGKVQHILLLGERHSGTNWITDHLVDCFAEQVPIKTEYARFKHWFQNENSELVPPKSAIVISMFRDPYDWVWAMKERPHHAHDHMNLPWLKFVTKPWIGNGYNRGKADLNITKEGKKWNVTCLERYSYVDIFPCNRKDELHVSKDGYGDFKYELMHDGSERAYSSIVDLRKEKIENHLSVSKLEGPRAFYPFRYEDLYGNGTEVLLDLVERSTGLNRNCTAVEAKGAKKEHKEVPKEYVSWMNRFVDWDVEGLIGYSRR